MMKITVTVIPLAKRDKVVQISKTKYKVYTTKPAVNNKANSAVLELLSKHFQIKKSELFLTSGANRKEKFFEIL